MKLKNILFVSLATNLKQVALCSSFKRQCEYFLVALAAASGHQGGWKCGFCMEQKNALLSTQSKVKPDTPFIKISSGLFIVVFVFLCFFCSQVQAEDVGRKSRELAVLQSKIKQISHKINDLNEKKDALLGDLKKLDKQFGASTLLLIKLEKQVSALNDGLKKNRQQIYRKKQDIKSQQKGLSSQVKAAYGMGRNEKLKMLLNQQDPALSGRVMVYYEYLNKARQKKIDDFKLDLQELQVLERKKQSETALLKSKLKERALERSVLLKTKKDRRALLKQLDKQFVSEKHRLDHFKESENRLKQLISSLQMAMDDFPLEEGSVKEFSQLKGVLPWPVKGKVAHKFGAKRSDSRWDGVLIKTAEGANVRAVTRGRVVYADWLRGYGLLTIIDHGKGYMTLYAFNQSLFKSVGDWVDEGTVIATAGQSGGQTDIGLYFGIRKKGKPVNPVKWCRKIRRGTIG